MGSHESKSVNSTVLHSCPNSCGMRGFENAIVVSELEVHL